jgi:two-component system, chemotaxis family, CheB/CheR fusion protein
MKKQSTRSTAAQNSKALEAQAKKRDAADPTAFPVAGIGASAGGVQASSALLDKLAPDLGMAYVFIHHLSPDHQSNLTEILQRKTGMPVVKVKEGIRLSPDHVYVIPPNTFMEVDENVLRLKTRSRLDVPYHPIDYFMMSLAGRGQHKAIGILLSGTASDGTIGLKAIKEAGGITFAQDATAMHEQMPHNAIEAGYVDFVLSPAEIAKELASLVRHPFVAPRQEEEMVRQEGSIKKILNVVLQKKRVDFFSHYKRTTVYRRIMRRMALHKIDRIEEYAARLREDDGEVEALYHDFLINVTSFFREPEFYKELVKTVFPALVKELKPLEPIRIWIAGCATGEEAYSTAICLSEFLDQKRLSHPVNIFATDLNGRAIEKARMGIYAKSLLQHIAPKRLKTFFASIDGHYQVVKAIREMCIFSQHNLLNDPPFSRIDLISCQNVLIYLETAPQRKVVQAFHYALKGSGFLLTGKSESIGGASDLFQQIKKDSRLFSKKAVPHHPLDIGENRRAVTASNLVKAHIVRTETDVEKESDRLLLSRYVPATVLVNKDLLIIRFRGSTSAYLEPASGKASLNLLKMVKDELLLDLRAALQEAKKSGLVAIKENVPLGPRQKDGLVTIEVTPMKSGKDTYFLIVFREVIEDRPGEKGKPAKAEAQRAKIQKLEYALMHAREQIRATNEEFEATREELQSANEEILSSNEELQSINEELETSKEELQSSNEELTTINEELQNRNLELKQSRDYAEAIIETMRGPLMVLNAEMRIRTANRAFYEFFRLSKEDTEGHLFYNIADREWSIPALRDQIQGILPRKTEFKDFVINHDFPAIGNRTMIVNAHRLPQDELGKESLILLSFEDITRYKIAEESLQETQEQLKLALSAGSVGTWEWNVKTNAIRTSGDEQRLYGFPKGQSLQSYDAWEKTIHPIDLLKTREALAFSIENDKPVDTEYRILWPDGSTHWILAKANTYYDGDGRPARIVGVNIDVTDRRRAIEALEESERRFHMMSDNAPVMIWMTGPDKQVNFVNKTWLSFRGRSAEMEFGEGWFAGIHSEDKEDFLDVFNRSFDAQKEFKIDYRLQRHDGEYRWVMTHGVPRLSGDQRFIGFIGTCIDISDRIDLERQKDDFMGIASHELKTPVTSIKAYAQILQEKFRKSNDETSANMLTRLDLQIDKLTGLINTLLDVAKVQSGQMDYFDEYFDIASFVREVTEEMQHSSPKHTIIANVKTTGRLYGDRARLTQVLNNLISNAVKYSSEGKDVIVEALRDGDKYIFSVQDFGVGISQDMQQKVFGRFFRVSESSGNRVSGLGLGLFISTQIVKQQGGDLWVESQPGDGSKFYFSLPVKAE